MKIKLEGKLYLFTDIKVTFTSIDDKIRITTAFPEGIKLSRDTNANFKKLNQQEVLKQLKISCDTISKANTNVVITPMMFISTIAQIVIASQNFK